MTFDAIKATSSESFKKLKKCCIKMYRQAMCRPK